MPDTFKVDRVTLTRTEIADIFSEWERRVRDGEGEWAIADEVAARDLETHGAMSSEVFIRLACEQAAGSF